MSANNQVKISDNIAVLNGKEYRLGYNLRAQILYERLMGDMDGKRYSTVEVIIFFYSILTAFNRGNFTMDFDTFVDYLDEHPEQIKNLQHWSSDFFKKRKELDNAEPEEHTEDDKKKE